MIPVTDSLPSENALRSSGTLVAPVSLARCSCTASAVPENAEMVASDLDRCSIIDLGMIRPRTTFRPPPAARLAAATASFDSASGRFSPPFLLTFNVSLSAVAFFRTKSSNKGLFDFFPIKKSTEQRWSNFYGSCWVVWVTGVGG
jgi:hypothetical protein